MIFATEKALKDLGEKVSDSEKEEAEKLIEELKEALKGTDIEEIKKKKETLNEKAMALSTKVYEEAAKKAQENKETDSNESEPAKDDVVDAEFEVKK